MSQGTIEELTYLRQLYKQQLRDAGLHGSAALDGEQRFSAKLSRQKVRVALQRLGVCEMALVLEQRC